MERDFLGLSSKNVSVAVKEEITDEWKDAAPAGGSAMKWSFLNQVASHPQLMSFKAAQEDRPVKTGYDSLTGLTTISSAEPFNSSHKPYTSVVQKNTTFDKQGGTHQVHRSHEVKLIPIANKINQNISITKNTPLHQSFLASAGQNGIGSAVGSQHFGGVPIMAAPVSAVPPTGPVVGTTELRNAPKTSGPAQLTIFYGGSVCVYEDVSPERAQAIMLLAGNGPSMTPKIPPITAQVQAPALAVPRPSGSDGLIANQNHRVTLSPVLTRAISVTSLVSPQPAVGVSNRNNEKAVVKSIGCFSSPPPKHEPSKVVNSPGTVPITMISSAVPQARKASLARFLEKRKERSVNASPYAGKSADCFPPGSEGRATISTNSAGSCPLPAIN